MSVLFALLRHAPTIWNEAGRLQGSADICLSRAGKTLAEQWNLPPPYDAWRRVASPLMRARQTAQLLKPALAFTLEPRLREVRFGVWEGRLLAELERRRKRGFLAPGMEPPAQLKRRLRDWASHVARAGVPVLGVSHKGVIRAMRRLAGAREAWTDDCLQLFAAQDDGTVRLVRDDVALLPPS